MDRRRGGTFLRITETPGDLQLDWAVTGVFAGAAMIASLAAGRLGTGIPDKVLKRGFGAVVLVIAAYVAGQALLG